MKLTSIGGADSFLPSRQWVEVYEVVVFLLLEELEKEIVGWHTPCLRVSLNMLGKRIIICCN